MHSSFVSLIRRGGCGMAAAASLAIGASALAQLAPTTQPVPTAAQAQTAQPVKVEGAWVRARVPGGDATAGYMRLTAKTDMKLVGIATNAAKVSELHEMKLDGDVMRMRAVDAIDLPAGKTVELKPGGHHLMLMGLTAPLAQNTSMPLTLILRDASGKEIRDEMKVPVLSAPPAANLTGPGRPATK